jgi:opacity protein-like surface antigen
MATVRGRLGYLFQPGLLGYATAGFGFVSGSVSSSVSGFGLHERFSFSDTGTEFVFGIGLEGKLSPASTLRVEYLGYSDSEIDVIRAGLSFRFGN